MRSYLFTSESVSEGHPDKVCDRISDMVVDSYLSSGDPQTRVACEKLTTLTDKQADYIGVKKEGPFKDDSYRY